MDHSSEIKQLTLKHYIQISNTNILQTILNCSSSVRFAMLRAEVVSAVGGGLG